MHCTGADTAAAAPPLEPHHARKHMQTHKHKLHTTVCRHYFKSKKEPLKPVNLPTGTGTM